MYSANSSNTLQLITVQVFIVSIAALEERIIISLAWTCLIGIKGSRLASVLDYLAAH